MGVYPQEALMPFVLHAHHHHYIRITGEGGGRTRQGFKAAGSSSLSVGVHKKLWCPLYYMHVIIITFT